MELKFESRLGTIYKSGAERQADGDVADILSYDIEHIQAGDRDLTKEAARLAGDPAIGTDAFGTQTMDPTTNAVLVQNDSYVAGYSGDKVPVVAALDGLSLQQELWGHLGISVRGEAGLSWGDAQSEQRDAQEERFGDDPAREGKRGKPALDLGLGIGQNETQEGLIDKQAATRAMPVPREVVDRALGALEPILRRFTYYSSLDPGLTFESFRARELPVPPPPAGDEGLGRLTFLRRYGSNPFVDTRRDHLSTFGMDVDTASYTYARNVIRGGSLPNPRAVRIEEFVNYFPEEYAVDPGAAFSVFCEGGPSPFGHELELLKIAVKARELVPGERKNAILTYAIDTSGSMASRASDRAPSEASRLELVRASLRTLVAALGPEDRVGIVAYNTHPYLVLPHTSARDRSRICGAIDSLEPGGATNVESALDLVYRVADEVFEPKAINRVILCSDGVANVGARGPEEILKRVAVFAGRGIYLSCVGFGMGKYNDAMLETLANKGNGNYAYVDSAEEAEKIFRTNLPATLQVLAQDAKIQVDFNPEVVSSYRLLGYENRDIQDKDFRNDKVDAGEVGPGSTVTVLYEIRRRTNPQGDLGRIYLRYRDTGTGRIEEVNYPLSPGVLGTSLAETSDRFRFIAAVAEAAELLRNSYWSRDGSYAKVLALLSGLTPEFRALPACAEVVELVRGAQAFTVKHLAMQAKLAGRPGI